MAGLIRPAVLVLIVCPNVAARTKDRIAQSKRARAGCLAIVDKAQVARSCILRAFLGCLQMPCCLALALRLLCFVSSSYFCFHWSRCPSFNRSSLCVRHGSTQLANNCYCYLCPFVLFLFLLLGRCCFFPRIFVPLIAVSSRVPCAFSYRMVFSTV